MDDCEPRCETLTDRYIDETGVYWFCVDCGRVIDAMDRDAPQPSDPESPDA